MDDSLSGYKVFESGFNFRVARGSYMLPVMTQRAEYIARFIKCDLHVDHVSLMKTLFDPYLASVFCLDAGDEKIIIQPIFFLN